MPWLLLDMQTTNDLKEIELSHNEYQVKAPADTKVQLVAMDTDKGKVTEVEYRIVGGTIKERAPTLAEMRASKGVLGPKIDPERHKIEAQLRNAKAELSNARSQLSIKDNELSVLKREKTRKSKRDTPSLEQDKSQIPSFSSNFEGIIEAALYEYIGQLRENNQVNAYQEAKELYREVTGEVWEPITADDTE